jgi:hypothetical protein
VRPQAGWGFCQQGHVPPPEHFNGLRLPKLVIKRCYKGHLGSVNLKKVGLLFCQRIGEEQKGKKEVGSKGQF